ncbi:FAD-dependent monooxygenase [Nocardiopsis flavescens]|uniref:FAD-dependent monooxygenase n=1 Tax=Nocardiopsis flavescens TaxID=758803 RepID=UPI0009329488|nr:FAD-dependent monooxygenase [Nocardiopsis flavescens]
MPTRNRTVLVAGAGVAGSAFAYWAAQHGFTPTVVDREPRASSRISRVEIGFGGVGVLERMGIVDRLADEVGPPPTVEFHFRDDAEPVRVPAASPETTLVVRRDPLLRELRALASANAEHVFGDSVTGLEETPDGVDVEFENGPARRFDLVVGADGLHSTVRGLSFEGTEADHVHDLGVTVAIFTVPDFTGQDALSSVLVRPGRGAMLSDIPGEDALEAVLLHRRPRGGRDTERETPEELAAAFAEDGWHVPRILDEMSRADVRIAPTRQVRLDTWSRGRVVLLGNAAFCSDPMSGMDTALALKGAMSLAGELARVEGDHRSGYFAYEAAMRPHVEHAQWMGEYTVDGVAPSGGSSGLRLTRAAVWAGAVATRVTSFVTGGNNLTDAGPEFPFERYAPAGERDTV